MTKQQIKAISFDMWGTLLKSNPQYKIERAKIIQNLRPEYTLEYIESVFNDVKKDIDFNVEKFGLSFNSLDVYQTVCNILDIDISCMTLQNLCENTFLQNMPTLYEDTNDILQLLYELDYELILASNTMFIQSNILRKVLQNLGIEHYFDKLLFSDELNVSKPNVLFYQQVHMEAQNIKKNIMHVGDNLITDIIGAKDYGFNYYQVHSNNTENKTLTDLYKYLKNA